jgi:nicotinamidase-related amidase
VLRAAGILCTAFRRHELPVVLVNVMGGAPGRMEMPRRQTNPSPDWAEFLPELGQQPSDIVVTKKTWGAFASTDLEARLKKLGVTQVVVCGIATTAGVESTARQAFEAGFNVTLAIDAMTDMNADAHENSITRIFPRIGETGTAAEIVALLDHSKA